MSEGFIVRRARIEDVEGVLRVERGAMGAPHWGEEVYRELLQDAEGARRVMFVATSEEGVVGFAVWAILMDEAELESVAVDGGARRQGIGRALSAAGLEWARERGVREVRLEVRAGNVAAQALYRGLGFIDCGRRMRYYSEPVEDAVMMIQALKQG